MKNIKVLLFLLVSLTCASTQGQGTAFTYQGRLNDGASPAAGSYDLQFAIYDSTNTPGTIVAGPLTNSAIAVSNGLFAVTLNFGPAIFDGAGRWLEISVRPSGGGAFTTLTPRQPLTPSPYAIFAGGASAAGLTGTIPASSIGGTYSNPVNFNNGANSFSGTFIGQFLGLSFIGGSFSGAFVGDGSGLINLNASQLASGTVPDARLPFSAARTNQVWLLSGNSGTAPGPQFLGTTDDTPFELKVANDRVFRFEPAPEVPNIIGGSRSNWIGADVQGATIAGGGLPLFPNVIQHDYGTIGGGTFHIVSGPWGTIAGGRDNRVHSESATVAGGWANLIQSNSIFATIAGGGFNAISSNSLGSVISGGQANSISNSSALAVIVGGINNHIGFAAGQAFLGGGSGNQIQSGSFRSVIVGGVANSISNDSSHATLVGGLQNAIATNASYATVSGGKFNLAMGEETTVAGGAFNKAMAFSAAIGGGGGHRVEGLWSVVAGGRDNIIGSNTYYGTIAGGVQNHIDPSVATSTIGGGEQNVIRSNTFDAVISGGYQNLVESAASGSVIAGGSGNRVTGPGLANVSGGHGNLATGIGSAVAGGGDNTAGGPYGTVAGGHANQAMGSYSLAAGHQAQALADGTFVWADTTPAPFASVVSNEFAVRATGGVRLETAGAGLTVDGQPVLAGGSSGNGGGLTNVNASALGGVPAAGFWRLGGNNANSGDFIGTTNIQPLELRVAGSRAMRLQSDGSGGAHVIAGSRSNALTLAGAFGTTIAGGGHDNGANLVTDDFATVGGGIGNIAGNTNGSFDRAAPTVAGGERNTASGSYSAIPGGQGNVAAGNFSFAAGRFAKANHNGAFVWNDSSIIELVSTNNDSVTMRANGGYRLFSSFSSGVFLAAGSGTWTAMSDRNAKENFQPVNTREVLERVAAMPIQSWNYKTQDPTIRHLGPMAQDFKAAFGVGESDTGITTVDADGVALAAIQGLNSKTEDRSRKAEARIERLEAENAELKRELAELKQFVGTLADTAKRGGK